MKFTSIFHEAEIEIHDKGIRPSGWKGEIKEGNRSKQMEFATEEEFIKYKRENETK